MIKRALVLDDDQQWRDLLVEVLLDNGFQPEGVGSLEQLGDEDCALYSFALIDLCLDPHNHRNEDGLIAADLLRRNNEACVVWMLTGHATVELAVEAMAEHGISYVLRKERFDSVDLANRLARIQFPPAEKFAEQEDGKLLEKLSILVVDDDPAWRDVLGELLSGIKNLDFAEDPAEALVLLRKSKYDAAIVDLLFHPQAAELEMGMSLTRQASDLIHIIQSQGIKVIVLSGMSDVKTINDLVDQRDISFFMAKTQFSAEKLIRLLEELENKSTGSTVLTEREQVVYDLVVKGYTNKEIAASLLISTNTVKRHLKSIFAKVGVHSRTRLAARKND